MLQLEQLEKLIKKIEDPRDPDNFHKFIDTAIYRCLKYNLLKQESPNQTTQSNTS